MRLMHLGDASNLASIKLCVAHSHRGPSVTKGAKTQQLSAQRAAPSGNFTGPPYPQFASRMPRPHVSPPAHVLQQLSRDGRRARGHSKLGAPFPSLPPHRPRVPCSCTRRTRRSSSFKSRRRSSLPCARSPSPPTARASRPPATTTRSASSPSISRTNLPSPSPARSARTRARSLGILRARTLQLRSAAARFESGTRPASPR